MGLRDRAKKALDKGGSGKEEAEVDEAPAESPQESPRESPRESFQEYTEQSPVDVKDGNDVEEVEEGEKKPEDLELDADDKKKRNELLNLTKSNLLNISEYHNLDVNKRWKKAQIVDAIMDYRKKLAIAASKEAEDKTAEEDEKDQKVSGSEDDGLEDVPPQTPITPTVSPPSPSTVSVSSTDEKMKSLADRITKTRAEIDRLRGDPSRRRTLGDGQQASEPSSKEGPSRQDPDIEDSRDVEVSLPPTPPVPPRYQEVTPFPSQRNEESERLRLELLLERTTRILDRELERGYEERRHLLQLENQRLKELEGVREQKYQLLVELEKARLDAGNVQRNRDAMVERLPGFQGSSMEDRRQLEQAMSMIDNMSLELDKHKDKVKQKEKEIWKLNDEKQKLEDTLEQASKLLEGVLPRRGAKPGKAASGQPPGPVKSKGASSRGTGGGSAGSPTPDGDDEDDELEDEGGGGLFESLLTENLALKKKGDRQEK